MKELSSKEITLVLEKIRMKYHKLIGEYDKSSSLLDGFEARYITTLKLRRSLTAFIMAEIEAVDKIYQASNEKRKEDLEKKYAKPQKSFADKIIEQNQKRYMQYTKVDIPDEADEEIAYLCGAARGFLNNSMPVIVMILRYCNNTVLEMKSDSFYNELTEHIGYKGNVPIIKHYLSVIETNNQTRIMFEYQRAIQNVAFLLNEGIEVLKQIKTYIDESSLGLRTLRTTVDSSKLVSIKKDFLTMSNKNIVSYITNEIIKITSDFRLKDIKKV